MQNIPKIQDIKNLLILRGEGSLGDAILSSCCYREYKKVNPNLKISVVCFGSATAYLKTNKYIDKLYVLPIPRVLRPNQRWPSLIYYGLKMRAKKFDLVIDTCKKDFKNWRLFRWLCGKDMIADHLSLAIDIHRPPLHASEAEGKIVSVLTGNDTIDASYDLTVPEETKERVRQFLTQHNIGCYTLLNPFASVVQRTLNNDTVSRMCNFLNDKYPSKNIIIPAMPSQVAAVQGIIKQNPAFNIIMFETKSLFDMFELVNRSGFVITPDTAIAHVASGFERKSIIFYNTFSEYNAPNNPAAAVIKTDPGDINKFNWQDFEQAFK
ncbi:ADP-heptose:LPS heptosyltransferase [Elusimicrobium simillimum]|uniref:glycosyltransferase family 9 protein n=1 Tax=Elusimicrobium simillimum TaxID=3143438 RepID=UPI003C6FC0D4